ncbi:MAG: 2-phosphosulfolactate phosphatase [Pirellulales bacterium]|nr:2-phosphosulfolactate phosphatase [Pirellulales bacterium]
MYSTLAVHFLPSLTSAAELAAGVVVVVDVLRASTTITAALASGAHEVVPCLEIEEARQKRSQWKETPQSPEPPLLGGERGGLPISGFDLGNSPRDFSPAAVRHRTLIFTTTNGTQALKICTAAARVLIGAPANFSAVASQLDGKKPIHILCAGTRGRITREDVFFAGAIVERLTQSHSPLTDVNDEARIACDVWQSAMGSIRPPDPRANQRIAEVLLQTQGGMNLTSVGLQADINDAAEVDRYDFVPEFDTTNWRIYRP